MILVVGATGLVGQRVARTLAEQGRPVRALVRPAADSAKVAALGGDVELRRGDLKDPESLSAACAGVRTVISTASATISRGAGDNVITVDRDGQLALVDAARAAGVDHFIYLSFSGGFRLDNSAKSVDDPMALSLSDRVSLGVSDYHALFGAAQLRIPAGKLWVAVEGSLAGASSSVTRPFARIRKWLALSPGRKRTVPASWDTERKAATSSARCASEMP